MSLRFRLGSGQSPLTARSRWLGSGALLAAAFGLQCSQQPAPPIAQTPPTPTQNGPVLADSPALQAAFIESRQAEGEKDPAFHFRAEGSQKVARHPQQPYVARLDGHGLRVEAGGETLALSLRSLGCSEASPALAPVEPTADKHQAELARKGLREWYTNGPLGIEQGFDLDAAPCADADRELRLDLALSGSLTPRAQGADIAFYRATAGQNDRPLLRYAALFVKDADGKPVPAHFDVASDHLAIVVQPTDAKYPLRIDPLLSFEEKILTASSPSLGALLGASVALSGDGNRALVGAEGTKVGALSNAGAAYVYTRSAAGTWSEEKILTASNAATGDFFGTSVALSGDGSRALVGSVGADVGGKADAGAVYVFTRGTGGTWSEEKILTASNAAAGDTFGTSVGLSSDGSRALVGAPQAAVGGKGGAGAAYVYTRAAAATWNEDQILTASNFALGDQFGKSVALSGDGSRALVGAIAADVGGKSDAGAAYVYTRGAIGSWSEEKILTASVVGSTAVFGTSVALSTDGTRALVGAPDAGSLATGEAYVYTRGAGGMWSEEKILTASNKATADGFGRSVSLSGDGSRALVGAPGADPGSTSNAGAAYLYTRDAMAAWTEGRILVSSRRAANNQFGQTVSLSADGSRGLVGEPLASVGGNPAAGAAYVFTDGKPNGDPCAAATECQSGFCADGVCCDTACGGSSDTDCQACTTAKGAAANGTCGTTPAAANFVCRASGGACDIADKCDGTGTTCPSDAKQPSTFTCRSSAGVCDVAENCTGTTNNCPGDAKKSNTTVCRAAAGACDAAELCDGSNNACPANALKPMGTMCKAAGASATCDPADFCDGTRTSCPANFAPYGTACGTGLSCNGIGRCL